MQGAADHPGCLANGIERSVGGQRYIGKLARTITADTGAGRSGGLQVQDLGDGGEGDSANHKGAGRVAKGIDCSYVGAIVEVTIHTIDFHVQGLGIADPGLPGNLADYVGDVVDRIIDCAVELTAAGN